MNVKFEVHHLSTGQRAPDGGMISYDQTMIFITDGSSATARIKAYTDQTLHIAGDPVYLDAEATLTLMNLLKSAWT